MIQIGNWIDFSDGAKEVYTLERYCIVCDTPHYILVDAVKYRLWDSGQLIQNVWPELSMADREMIKLGYHEACWNKLFSPEEDDE